MDATEPRGERPTIHAYKPEPAMQRSVRDRQTREQLEQELDSRQQRRHLQATQEVQLEMKNYTTAKEETHQTTARIP